MHEIEPLEVPSLEDTAAAYNNAAAALDIYLPAGVSFGALLARLEPKSQDFVRAEQGMFPFKRAQSLGRIAVRYGVSPAAIDKRLHTVHANLAREDFIAHSELNMPVRPPLEDLAGMLNECIDTVSPDDQLLLRAVYGLPPYDRVMESGLLQRTFDLSAAGITKTSRSIIDALQGKNAANRSWVGAVVDGASGSVRISKNGKAVLTDAEWQRHFASRDAGVYAELLLALRPGEGQQLAVQQLIDNLITRAKLRGRLRKVAEKNPHPLRGFSEYSTLSADRLADSRQEHLADKRAMNPDIETQDGRTQLVTRLVGRAALLTDGEALLLQDIAEDGRLAVAELCDRNVALCYYAAATVRHKLNDAHMYGLVPAAFEGLRGAVTRFDPALGFVFSSFAVRTMEGHMARSATKDLAARTGITASAWTRIFSIRKTESRLSQELGRQPTEEEIVASGIYAVRTVESLRSYREKEAYATRRSYALDLSSPRYADGGHMNEEAVGLAEYTSAQTAADSNEDLSEALEAAFVAAGLSDYEQTMQKRLHGLHPFAVPLTPDELAVELGVEPKLVKNQLRQAYKKIVDSPEAGSVLAKFLRRND